MLLLYCKLYRIHLFWSQPIYRLSKFNMCLLQKFEFVSNHEKMFWNEDFNACNILDDLVSNQSTSHVSNKLWYSRFHTVLIIGMYTYYLAVPRLTWWTKLGSKVRLIFEFQFEHSKWIKPLIKNILNFIEWSHHSTEFNKGGTNIAWLKIDLVKNAK